MEQLYNAKQIADAHGSAKRSVERRLKTVTPAKLEPHPGHPIRWYGFNDLPADYQKAIKTKLTEKAILAARIAKPEISDFIVVLDGEVFEVRKIG